MCNASWRERTSYMESGWDLNYVFDKPTNTLALLIEEDDTLYVVFRGSQFQRSEIDRRYNARVFRRKPDVGGLPGSVRTHTGFTEKYHAIREAVMSRIVMSDARHIVTVGHSAGGALAVLAFIDLLEVEPQRLSHTVTFGMPRLVNRAGAKALEPYRDRIVRVVNGADLVTRVPAAFMGYRHVGTFVQVGSRSGLQFLSFHDHNRGYTAALRQHVVLGGEKPDRRFAPAPRISPPLDANTEAP